MLLCLTSCSTSNITNLQRCTVSRVIDGDTFVCDDMTVRLAGIDAPELDEHHGQESYDMLKEMIDDRVLWIDVTGIGYYGRTIAYSDIDWIDIGKYLLVNGHARHIKYKHKYSDNYSKFERMAKRHQKGIWAY
tara:strand:- start:877 stop:1275 length:399 start_codon:yes stop_codon:yes gene_type:complete